MTSRADLHVHSKHSNQPSEWILRQFRAPESFTEPLEVYRLCRERGMDFVTLSDHDTVAGALEIAHLPGTFLSSEVTVEFPEDGCEVHCLVTGISEAQHREIQRLRRNVYEFRDYLRDQGIVHSVAHPLFRVNDRLTLAQVEKLIVLFNRFEALNGIHDRRANGLVRRIFGSLDAAVVADLAERHRLAPMGAHPEVKTFTGGSDDHGGFYVGTTWTRTPPAATVEEYLDHLRTGRHEPGGDTGSTARLMQSLYSISWEFYRRQFPALLGNRKDPFAELLRRLAQPGSAGADGQEERGGLRERLAQVVAFPGARRPPGKEPAEPVERTTFAAAGKAQRGSLSSLARELVRHLRHGRLAEGLSSLTHLAPLALSLAPYLVAIQAQHKDADLLEAAALRFLGRLPEDPEANGGATIAWFTDLPAGDDATPTARMVIRAGRRCETIDCRDSRDGRFAPLLELPLPGESQPLRVPPLLEILDHAERERYAEIVIATPGPVGLAGLAAGKLLGIRRTAVHRGDFMLPFLAGSPALEELAWAYLRWFFRQMDRVWVTRGDRELLIARGVDPARLALLPAEEEGPTEPLFAPGFDPVVMEEQLLVEASV